MKKKIYINGRFLTQATTGVQRYGQEIVRAFDAMMESGEISASNYEIVVLTPSRGVREIDLRQVRIESFGSMAGHLWEQWELPSRVHDGVLFCPGNLAPYRSLLSKRISTVVTLHDLSFIYFSQAYSLRFTLVYEILVDLAIRMATSLITVSEHEKKKIVASYPEVSERLFSIPLGVRLRVPESPEVKKEKEEPYILFVGSINRIKNLASLLEALYLVQAAFPIRLKVVGGSSSRVFRPVDLSGVLKKVEHIEFLGQLNDAAQLYQLYAGATFLVMPSFTESFGFPCIEAMSLGCPVLASDIGGLRDICGEAALYCDPFDVIDIAEKILQLWTHPAKRTELSRLGREQAKTFTWEKTARETWTIIQLAADRRAIP